MKSGMTVGGRIEQTGGYTSGFDYIRIILATAVVFLHSFGITGTPMTLPPMLRGLDTIFGYSLLPMFFALSGFLVAASLVRTKSIVTFMCLRGLRILPALVVEIALSALILGPLLTSVSLREYFTHTEFFQYFLNMLGYIHYNLPGVFMDHPIERTVNGSLWTVPYEAECYIALAAISLLGVIKRPKLFLTGFLLLAAGMLAWALVHGDTGPVRETATGRQLVLFFLAGVLMYIWRERIAYSGWIALACLVFSSLFISSHTWIYLAPLPLAYVTMYLGLLQPKKLPLIFTGDYSYGIYLYAFPMQQAAFQLFAPAHAWYFNFLFAMVAVSVFAAFSWHCVEKPTLGLKRWIVRKNKASRPVSGEMISPDKTNPTVAESGDGGAGYGSLGRPAIPAA